MFEVKFLPVTSSWIPNRAFVRIKAVSTVYCVELIPIENMIVRKHWITSNQYCAAERRQQSLCIVDFHERTSWVAWGQLLDRAVLGMLFHLFSFSRPNKTITVSMERSNTSIELHKLTACLSWIAEKVRLAATTRQPRPFSISDHMISDTSLCVFTFHLDANNQACYKQWKCLLRTSQKCAHIWKNALFTSCVCFVFPWAQASMITIHHCLLIVYFHKCSPIRAIPWVCFAG